MSRIRTLRLLLAVTAAAWAMIITSIGGLIAVHLASSPAAHVAYAQPVHAPPPAHVWTGRCPPPPCCPHGHMVAYVPPVTHAPEPQPVWPFALVGLAGACVTVALLASRGRIVPVQS